jgi:crossover junction endodeoxyribonuclease RuvC
MPPKIIRIMGVDPGLSDTGWGVVDCRGHEIRAVGCGDVKTSKELDLGKRLQLIHRELRELAIAYQPHAVSVETLYFARNVKSAMVVAQARGVAVLAVTGEGAQLHEYTPSQIKQAVVGRGNATKSQVHQMVQTIARMDQPPSSDHAADALAAAICHSNFTKFDR